MFFKPQRELACVALGAIKFCFMPGGQPANGNVTADSRHSQSESEV